MRKNQLFPTCLLFFLVCPLLEGNFHRDNPNRTWTFCPLMRGVCYFCPLFRGFFIRDLYEFVRSSNFWPLFGGVRYSRCPLIRGATVFFLKEEVKAPWNLVEFCGEQLVLTITNICTFVRSVDSMCLHFCSVFADWTNWKIPMKVWCLKCFISMDSSDEQIIFDGL